LVELLAEPLVEPLAEPLAEPLTDASPVRAPDELSLATAGSVEVVPLEEELVLGAEVPPAPALSFACWSFFIWPVCLPWFTCSRPCASRVTFGLSVGPAPESRFASPPASVSWLYEIAAIPQKTTGKNLRMQSLLEKKDCESLCRKAHARLR
jgi:hypothetical protein